MVSPAGTKVTETEQDESDTGTGAAGGTETAREKTEEQPQPAAEQAQAPPKPESEASEPQAPQEPPKAEGEPEPSPTAPTTRIRTVEKAEPQPKAPRFSPVRLVMGGVLILGGIAWLLEVTNAVSINWGVLLSAALLAAGAGLILLGLRGGTNRGLVILGIVLAIILTAAATLRIDIAGGIGGRTVHPTSAKSLAKSYRMAMGQLTIDLRHVNLGGGTPKVRASVGLGQLVVLVPPDANVRIHERAGAGQISAFTHSQSGVDLEHTFFHGSGPPVVTLDLSVGLGQVTVHR